MSGRGTAERFKGAGGPARSERRLLDALARVCRGATRVAGPDPEPLAGALRRAGTEVETCAWTGGAGFDALAAPGVRTVVLDRGLGYVDEAVGAAWLAEAWRAVPAGGRLVVCVANQGLDQDPGAVRRFDRRTLTRMLREFGKPRLSVNQPYRWLVMWVGRPKPGPQPLDRKKRDRLEATARRCRGRVLELGCGPGLLSSAIAGRGCEVTGVDLNEPKIAAAREAHPGLTFLAGDILVVDLEREAFDTVVIAEVLEHVDEITGDRMLARAWDCLRPGGRLVVSVPNEDLVPHRNHVREFDRKGLRKLLSRFGTPRTVSEQPFQWLLMTVEKRP